MEYGHFKEENFSKRHIGLNEEDKRNLLKKLGYETMDKFCLLYTSPSPRD